MGTKYNLCHGLADRLVHCSPRARWLHIWKKTTLQSQPKTFHCSIDGKSPPSQHKWSKNNKIHTHVKEFVTNLLCHLVLFSRIKRFWNSLEIIVPWSIVIAKTVQTFPRIYTKIFWMSTKIPCNHHSQDNSSAWVYMFRLPVIDYYLWNFWVSQKFATQVLGTCSKTWLHNDCIFLPTHTTFIDFKYFYELLASQSYLEFDDFLLHYFQLTMLYSLESID